MSGSFCQLGANILSMDRLSTTSPTLNPAEDLRENQVSNDFRLVYSSAQPNHQQILSFLETAFARESPSLKTQALVVTLRKATGIFLRGNWLPEDLYMDLTKFAKRIDDWCRVNDLNWERMDGGPLQRFQVKRENIEAFLWPSLIAAAFWTGFPTLNRVQLIGIAIGVGAFLLFIVANRWSKTPLQDLAVQVAFLVVLGTIIFLIGPDEAGTGSLVYRHGLIPIALITGICLLLSALLASRLFAPLQENSQYAQYLKETEMFQARGTRLPLATEPWASFLFSLTSVLLHPMELLLPVTAAILFTPPAWTHLVALVTFLATVALLLITAFDDRLDRSLALLVRRFSRNAALVVSLVAIGLAAARLAGNTYVTTVFDSASGIEILLYFLAAYAIAWWYDYWTERLIGQQLFRLIDAGCQGSCTANYTYTGNPYTAVPSGGRMVELLGLGRFLVYRDNPGNLPYFQAWPYRDFFVELASTGAPGGSASPLPQQISQRLTLYLGSTAFLALVILGCGGWVLHGMDKNYELSVKTGQGSGLQLAQLIDPETYGPGNPAILASASGGGTRAAVFAGAVLEGLSEENGDRIRAGSGVSGGSAALAYYAAHREALRCGEEKDWDDYFHRMTMPFIRDVIERAQEWRMTVHGRVGILLAESFERRWEIDPKEDHFGQVSDFGLICNTTLAGRFEKPADSKLSLGEAAARFDNNSDVAGGRLILTNLSLQDAFAVPDPQPPFISGVKLPVVIDDRETRLERAAALSANFPPVFSNAAIDVGDQTRYWVTDGGAADNRGLEPLLFGLRYAVLHQRDAKLKLPNIAVVIIEASGIDESFVQTRGLGSAFGAGAHFADQLDKELYANLHAIYAAAGQKDDLQFYYIAMPQFLRTSGSFGTHWMLQNTIKVKHDDSVTKSFSGTQVVRALRAAYGCRDAGDSAELANWIRTSPEFDSWCRLRRDLKNNPCGCAAP